MSLGSLETETDLLRWIEANVLPIPVSSVVSLPTFIAQPVTVSENVAPGVIEGQHLAPETIEAKNILAGTIEAKQIAAGTIVAANIAAGTITATQIAAHTITGEKIAAGTITAETLSVSELSAITANLGTVTAGSIKGVTITGGTIQTSATNPRVLINAEGIQGLDVKGTAKFKFETATGIAYVIGVLSSEDGSEIPTKHLSGQIKETQIEPEAISTPLLAANSVTATKIVAATITGSKIAAGTITAEKLSVSELSAITANLGTVTAGKLVGTTIETSTGLTKLNNEGVQIVAEKTATPKAAGKIVWKNGAGSIVSELFSITLVNDATYIRATSEAHEGEKVAAELNLEARSKAAEPAAGVFIRSRPKAAIPAQVGVMAGVSEHVLLDGEGRSEWLQLVEVVKRKTNFAEVSAKFAASKESELIEVKHGLGAVPKDIQLTVKNLAGGVAAGLTPVIVAEPTETAFKFKVSCQEPTSITVAVYWKAIG